MKITAIALVVLALLCSSLVAVHLYLLDGLDGWLLSLAGEDTVYAASYSDSSFRHVHRGLAEVELLELLGPPLGEVWFYSERLPGRLDNLVSFAGDVVDHVLPERSGRLVKIVEGMKRKEVIRVTGEPRKKVFVYSRSRGDQSYRVRAVTLNHGTVTRVEHYFYAD